MRQASTVACSGGLPVFLVYPTPDSPSGQSQHLPARPALPGQLARLLDSHRDQYDAFLIAHGTDTMAYTASALSLMLAGFRKPIVMTGSQLPLALPRSDVRGALGAASPGAMLAASPGSAFCGAGPALLVAW